MRSASKRVRRSTPLNATAKLRDAHSDLALFHQREALFTFLPDSVIACNQNGKILRINAAALKLLEVPSESSCRGRDIQEFFQCYAPCDEQQRPLSPEHWLMCPMGHEAVASSSSERTITLQVPSGRRICVNIACSPVLDTQKHARGKEFVFHEISQRYQQALYLQRVHEAVQTLTEAIAHLPERLPLQSVVELPEGSPLLSPPVIFVAQQLVDVIRHVLDCHWVNLKALGPAGHVLYVAFSGFTVEQERPERESNAFPRLSEILEETALARLYAGQEVILRGDCLRLPPEFVEMSFEVILVTPLFLAQRLVGILCVFKTGLDSVYTPGEIELVKAVAIQATQVMECLAYLYKQTESQIRERVVHEVQRLSNDFLTLASHELRTPLTGILGNLQLAQRRLAVVKRTADEHIEQAQQPLASAEQYARLQQRIINDIIDDARIQTNQLELYLQRCDLLALLKEVIAKHQQLMPERTIVLEIRLAAQEVPILADVGRITKVITTYLMNALTYSPAELPVTVQVAVEDLVARVAVHNEGIGIPFEEQQHLWERFYRTKGSAVQNELDLSLGLGLYLCKTFIERHHGRVGVQSDLGRGALFWFTVPIAPTVAG